MGKVWVASSTHGGILQVPQLLVHWNLVWVSAQYFKMRAAVFVELLFLVSQLHFTSAPVLSTLNMYVLLSLHPSLGAEEGIFDKVGFCDTEGLALGLSDGACEGFAEGLTEGLAEGLSDGA